MNSVPSKSLLDFLERYHHYIIIGHREPDGDCLGSSLALSSLLGRRGKRVAQVSAGPFWRSEIRAMEPLFLSELPGHSHYPLSETGVVTVDCGSLDQLGELSAGIKAYPVAMIDHHTASVPFTDISYIVPTALANTLLIQALFEAFGMPLRPEEAEWLLFGFVTDTGYFRHIHGNSGDTFRAVAQLTDAGASPNRAFQLMQGKHSLKALAQLGRVLERTRSLLDNRLLISHQSFDELGASGANSINLDDFYRLLFSVQGCEVIVVLREREPGVLSVSLRSNGAFDVAEVARRFGGGGHKAAAGFRDNRAPQVVEKELLAVLAELK